MVLLPRGSMDMSSRLVSVATFLGTISKGLASELPSLTRHLERVLVLPGHVKQQMFC